MKAMEKNGKKVKSAYGLLQKTGQGVKLAADTGYRTGYFMAKHPNVKIAKDQIQKNYRTGLLTLAGLGIAVFGMIKILFMMKK